MTPQSRSAVETGAGMVVFAAVILGLQNNLSPVVFAQGANPATLLLLRFGALVVVLAAWCVVAGKSMRLERTDVLPGYAAGLLFAAASGFVQTSFSLIPVSLAILIVYTQPILIFLAECALDRRLPRPLVLFCLAGAFLGLAVTLQVRIDTIDPVGLACAGAGAVCLTLALLCAARLVKARGSTALTLHMSIMGLVFAGLFTFLPGQFALRQDSAGEWAVLFAAVAIFGTGFFALFAGTRRIGASTATQIMNLEPVLTVSTAVAFFGESMTPVQAAGATLVISCVALAQWIRMREGRAARAAAAPPGA